jgi:hypothetical protein
MEQPITDLEHLSPEWLTRVLHRQGVLPHGKVTAVHKKSHSTFTARIVRLEARYGEGAPTSAPVHLFLKLSNPDVEAGYFSTAGQQEVAFYTTVVEAMSEPPTVRCYDAAYAPQTGHYHLLLADVSDTHDHPEWSLPPTQRQCEDVMECMAKFHAFWWDHPRLGQDIGTLPTAEGIKEGIVDTERKVRAFVDFLGDRLSGDRRHVYDKVLAAMPRLSCHLR